MVDILAALGISMTDTDLEIGPTEPIRTNETSVGIMNEDERIIFNAFDKLKDELCAIHDETEELRKEFAIKKRKYEALRNIFWCMVRTRLNLWGAGTLGIRNEWQIVTFEEDECKECAIPRILVGIQIS